MALGSCRGICFFVFVFIFFPFFYCTTNVKFIKDTGRFVESSTKVSELPMWSGLLANCTLLYRNLSVYFFFFYFRKRYCIFFPLSYLHHTKNPHIYKGGVLWCQLTLCQYLIHSDVCSDRTWTTETPFRWLHVHKTPRETMACSVALL